MRGLARLPQVESVSGLGLMLAARLDRPAAGVLDALREAGILAGGAEDKQALRLLPPLVLKASEADLFLDRLETILGRPPS
jgi:acetylornithine/succinyldiaminopimelate/putrescine aminotransferase